MLPVVMTLKKGATILQSKGNNSMDRSFRAEC